MKKVAGVDTSTQSCKVVVIDADTGVLLRSGTADHPTGTEVHPDYWWEAFQKAVGQAGGLSDVEAISVAGQQHGMVCLDENGEVIRPALIWNDTRSAEAAEDLINELGQGDYDRGKSRWIDLVGSAPVAALTVSKLRWFVDNEPALASKIAAICLPHDWLTWKILGMNRLDDLVTDRSDASGTGYLDRHTAEYRYELLAMALRCSIESARKIVLPRVLEPLEAAGIARSRIAEGLLVGPGCGDNAGGALGVGLQPGEGLLSLGTSGVVAAICEHSVADFSGQVSGFMDASGRWLPLACTLNASRILDAMNSMLNVDFVTLDDLALSAEAGAGGVKLTPYFEGERTPNLPHATATIEGLTLANSAPENLARAAVEGLLELMKYALKVVVDAGSSVQSLKLLGGGARSRAVQQLAPTILDIPVEILPDRQYVAEGAAKQAKAVLEASLKVSDKE